ncbi:MULTISPECIES: hypothetical protein [Enterococcus]|uniref:hypothetical protein n=1 Tax=Enterococcus TaxID=1350 RepID=UPI0010F9A2AE|nr:MULTISPECIES: hypothetical protein [Enterococcus]KAF1300136.1 hypothetical protein BAU16_12885 [Enterococcus sp. JM9B]
MGDTVKFPDEYQRLLWQGQQLMEKAEYLGAAAAFEKAYQLAPNFDNHLLWTKALVKLEDFDKVLRIAEDWYEEYFSHRTGFRLYTQTLLLSRRFLKAREYLLIGKKAKKIDNILIEELFQQLQQLENIQQLVDPESVPQKRRLLREFDQAIGPISKNDWDVFTQNVTYLSFLSLIKEFLPIATNPFVRPRLAEELVKLECNKIFVVKSLEGTLQEFQPNLLTLPEKAESLQQMIRHVEETTGQDDPALSAAIVAEIQAHFALAFPFPPQELQPEAWAESYVLEYAAMFGNEDANRELMRYQEIQQEKTRFREFFQQLIEKNR